MPGPDEIKAMQQAFIDQNPKIANGLARMLEQQQPDVTILKNAYPPPDEVEKIIQFEERNPSPLTEELIAKLLEEAKKHEQWPYPVVIANPDNS